MRRFCAPAAGRRKLPLPRRFSISPSCSSTASACRTVWRLTENCAESSCSLGSFRCPSAYHRGSVCRSVCTSSRYLAVMRSSLLSAVYCTIPAWKGHRRICSFSFEKPESGRRKIQTCTDRLQNLSNFFRKFFIQKEKISNITRERTGILHGTPNAPETACTAQKRKIFNKSDA